jgi:hypothetical protein
MEQTKSKKGATVEPIKAVGVSIKFGNVELYIE